MAYTSKLDYVDARIHAAAVYCSDGRFGAHVDEFLLQGLELDRVDRVAIPGGPATLAGHSQADANRVRIAEDVRFLVEAHKLNRMLLIQHEGCAFYAQKLGIFPERMRESQLDDLRRAGAYMSALAPGVKLEGWFARVDGGHVSFEQFPAYM